ncbi:hypothetical protein HHO41_20520 [Bacillus sp. DNRA2]|uniref:hypothetical protein n=1 Tax=Bacillus sp. DNRA2 TaxID=2723053 RepID=UPI00145FABC6|nr:hypothetical protein [Bacillus sp. DNRA2]NMD72626.1 hypothetical protein [Bacillus sp. DNRA2]
MENNILLEQLAKIPEIKLNKHPNSDWINGECITRKPHQWRKNVVGDINPTGNSFKLYKDGKWASKNTRGIKTVEEAIEWIKDDIKRLSK